MRLAILAFFFLALTGARPGPVPDYAPLALVRTHAQTIDLSMEFVQALDTLLGPRHVVVGDLNATGNLMWLRDYQPIYARDADNHLRALQVKSQLPERNGRSFSGDPPGVDLGLVHENGNLVVAGRYVFLSTLIFEANQADLPGPGAGAAQQALMHQLARAFGRPVEDIIILPRLPGEGTGHVDLFLLPISDERVLIPSIADEALVDLIEPEWEVARRAARFLDEQAATVERLGLTVKRLPMLPPSLHPSVDHSSDAMVFYSPANALLLNVEGKRTVLVPDIDPSVLRGPHRKLHKRYRQQWARTFQAEGWKPVFADATTVARYLGYFRCLTTVVPE